METWFTLLAAAVWRYLNRVAARAESEPAAIAAETRTLVAAWRAVLRLHDPGADGSCSQCKHKRGGICSVWKVALGYFVRRTPGMRAR